MNKKKPIKAKKEKFSKFKIAFSNIFYAFFGVFIAYCFYNLLAMLFYTNAVLSFSNIKWTDFDKYSISLNGCAKFVKKTSIEELVADPNIQFPSTIQLMCHKFSAGHNGKKPKSMSFIDDKNICCILSENQRMVPYYDDETTRHYLCGEWPLINEVSQPISLVRSF